MNKKVLHGNNAKATNKNIEPVYQTSVVTPKSTSDVKSKPPVTPVNFTNVLLAKECVDENHK